VIDSGADVSHPALAGNFRGGTNSWFDAVNGQASPYDDHGHGTATAGNSCGNDPAYPFYGTAPGAQFISTKVFDASGGGSDTAILAGADWILDPDGDPGTNDQPDIVNNSWGGIIGGDTWFSATVDAWRAAGIYPVFSIGNAGPDASTAHSPGDYQQVLGVGATDINNNIAAFSSRGPSAWGQIKPNVSAPGDTVTVPQAGGGYKTWSGTSFACPHVAGAAALVLQAQPEIAVRALDDITTVLQDTAVDLGAVGPDNDYGWGLIDCLAAVGQVVSASPRLTFLGRPGFESDGVSPDTGAANSVFTFRVKLTDYDGDEPDFVRLVLLKDRQQWAAIDMTGSTDPIAAGRAYRCKKRLPAGQWSYRFEAQDADGAATGDPTQAHVGPIMNVPPLLTWVGSGRYANGGVAPKQGQPRETVFSFRVAYWDYENDFPSHVTLELKRNGATYRSITMVDYKGLYPQLGLVFRAKRKLAAGAYQYRFTAADDDGAAHGRPTRWTDGPRVAASASALVLSALTAAPTRSGATQFAFCLSSTATVEARVFNLAGRPVRTLCRNQPSAAGANTLLWDARSDTGLRVPSGTYALEVTARTPDGAQSRAMVPVSVGR